MTTMWIFDELGENSVCVDFSLSSFSWMILLGERLYGDLAQRELVSIREAPTRNPFI